MKKRLKIRIAELYELVGPPSRGICNFFKKIKKFGRSALRGALRVRRLNRWWRNRTQFFRIFFPTARLCLKCCYNRDDNVNRRDCRDSLQYTFVGDPFCWASLKIIGKWLKNHEKSRIIATFHGPERSIAYLQRN